MKGYEYIRKALYICVFFILILFLLSVCRCCLCELEAYDTKTNSLYAQAYLAIKALSDSDYPLSCFTSCCGLLISDLLADPIQTVIEEHRTDSITAE